MRRAVRFSVIISTTAALISVATFFSILLLSQSPFPDRSRGQASRGQACSCFYIFQAWFSHIKTDAEPVLLLFLRKFRWKVEKSPFFGDCSMITKGFFNHICGICPQIHRIYRFFCQRHNHFFYSNSSCRWRQSGKSTGSGAEPQFYLVFIVFFLIPQMKYSVMLLQSRFLSYFMEFCVVKEAVGGTLKPWPEFVEGSFGARRGGVRRSPEGRGRSGGVQN